ncbi:tyrosine-type recombinase/integrase [Frisingicoccus sp.]|uniref:tyrosine-type recombinase/integrase n=1 Tax=Frisingicoccus sp. TaxID=1918627 RepID=UPI003AB56C91
MTMINYSMQLEKYIDYLQNEERSIATVCQYERDVLRFFSFLNLKELTKDAVLQYKQELMKAYQPVSVNVKLSALNSFFSFIGRDDLKLKLLKIQRSVYCSEEKELSKSEYFRLIQAAEKKKNKRLALLLQTICGTGIRVSELKYITAAAVNCGEAVIQLKGKTRTILLPKKLQKKLKNYLRRERIVEGPVFITRTGRPLDRSNIWKMMKNLCRDAGVDAKKVFPHNLRHLFARCFYSIDKDIARLADILGHSSINTTRIYIITSGTEHRRHLDALRLVV